MFTTHAPTLDFLIISVLADSPEGLDHVELVKTLLRNGYKYRGDSTLSHDTQQTVKRMVREGLLEKNVETRKIKTTWAAFI